MHFNRLNLTGNSICMRVAFIGFLAGLLLIFTAPVFADGMAIEIDPYGDRFDYAVESSQDAFISYEDGLQNMVLTIGLNDGNASELVWIFPVPSDPKKVVLDILRDIPELHGEELSQKTKATLRDIRNFIQATQIYTIPFMSMASKGGSTFSAGEGGFDSTTNYAESLGVTVYEHIEKEGITSEIVTAKTADGLYDYLSGKGLDVDEGAIPVLDHYIGGDFSFVVSWITGTTGNYGTGRNYRGDYSNRAQRGVFVTFPTDRIYYPLLPTSVYGSETVPAVIRIMGHVTPVVFNDIKRFTTTEYYVNGYLTSAEGLNSFYDGPGSDLKYTRIEIDAPSKFLTEDLWINRRAPVGTYFSSFVVNHSGIVGFILLVLSSVIAGIIAGWIIFRDLRTKILTLALIGLSNCLTIVGLIITVLMVRTKEIPEDTKALLEEIDKRGYLRKRKLALFLFIYSIIFLIYGLFLLPAFHGGWEYFGMMEIIFCFILPTVAFMRALDNMKVKSEDRGLFSELKEKNQSVIPIRGEKINFIWLYSISFLIISWLFVKFVEIIA